jgi:hypothetical protein
MSTVADEESVIGPIPSSDWVTAVNCTVVVTVRVSPNLQAPVQETPMLPEVNPVPLD